MGGGLEFSAVRSYSPKLVFLRASQPPLRTRRKWLKNRTVSGPKYTDQMDLSGDHPISGRFVRLDTRSKFIAMGRRLKFEVLRSYFQKLVSLRALEPPLRAGRK